MNKNITVTLFLLLMIAVIVGMDVLFFRNQLWARLLANIGTVLIFTAFCIRFFK